MLLFTNKNYSVIYSENEDRPYKVVNNQSGATDGSYESQPQAMIVAHEYHCKIEDIRDHYLKKESAHVVEFKPKG